MTLIQTNVGGLVHITKQPTVGYTPTVAPILVTVGGLGRPI